MSQFCRFTSRSIRARFFGFALAVLGASALAEPLRPTPTLVTPTVPAISFLDEHGRTTRLDEWLAASPEPVALQFIFTTCPGICPTLTATLTALGEKVRNLRRISISIDPEIDTPERLAEYESRFGSVDSWTLLTGEVGDSIAIQQAFGSYRGDKMRHPPLTFLRARGSASWLRFEGFPKVDDLAAAFAPKAAGEASRGRRLYRDGVSEDGREIEVSLGGGGALKGRAAACASCHRASGAGSVEGGLYLPPITARALFSDEPPRRIDLYQELFQEELEFETWARLRQRSPRPAYTEETLARALREGVDPSGRELDPRMPRYRLSEQEILDLRAYLVALGAPAPGVDAKTIHFAAVIPATSGGRESALVSTSEAFVRWKNADTARLRVRSPDPLEREDDWPLGYRTWDLAVWRAADDAMTWRREFEAKQQAQPVFALWANLSDFPSESAEALRSFCEAQEVPCLLLGTTKRERGEFVRGFPSGVCVEGSFEPEPPQTFRARQWLRARGLPSAPSGMEEGVQLATYSLLTLAEVAVRQLLDNFSRAAFIEAVDREVERLPFAVGCREGYP